MQKAPEVSITSGAFCYLCTSTYAQIKAGAIHELPLLLAIIAALAVAVVGRVEMLRSISLDRFSYGSVRLLLLGLMR